MDSSEYQDTQIDSNPGSQESSEHENHSIEPPRALQRTPQAQPTETHDTGVNRASEPGNRNKPAIR
jgi:hypothetical protein